MHNQSQLQLVSPPGLLSITIADGLGVMHGPHLSDVPPKTSYTAAIIGGDADRLHTCSPMKRYTVPVSSTSYAN